MHFRVKLLLVAMCKPTAEIGYWWQVEIPNKRPVNALSRFTGRLFDSDGNEGLFAVVLVIGFAAAKALFDGVVVVEENQFAVAVAALHGDA